MRTKPADQGQESKNEFISAGLAPLELVVWNEGGNELAGENELFGHGTASLPHPQLFYTSGPRDLLRQARGPQLSPYPRTHRRPPSVSRVEGEIGHDSADWPLLLPPPPPDHVMVGGENRQATVALGTGLAQAVGHVVGWNPTPIPLSEKRPDKTLKPPTLE